MCFHSNHNDKLAENRNEIISTANQIVTNSSTVQINADILLRESPKDANILNKWTGKWIKRNENTNTLTDSKSTDFIDKIKRIFKP